MYSFIYLSIYLFIYLFSYLSHMLIYIHKWILFYIIYSACAGVCVWYDIPYPSMSSLTNPCGSQTVSKPSQLKKLCNCLPNVSFKQEAVSQIRSRASCHDDHVSHHDTRIAAQVRCISKVKGSRQVLLGAVTYWYHSFALCCPVLPPLRWPCKIPQAGWPLRRSVGQTWLLCLGSLPYQIALIPQYSRNQFLETQC